MAPSYPQRLQQALLDLHAQAQSDHRLQAELQRARREFFGPAASRAPSPSAELRFLEWALLERESVALAAPPCMALPLAGDLELLRDSEVGVFRIETVQGEAAEARDLQEDEILDLKAPKGALQPGDLMVGRIYQGERGVMQPSFAVAVYRPGEQLAKAFRKDVARLELDRRLTQAELERLLLQAHAPERSMHGEAPRPAEPAVAAHRPVEHLEAELDALLATAGRGGLATEISEALAQAPAPGAVMGPLLDQLAFDTQVDLEQARQLLLELWNAHHPIVEPADAADDAATAAPPVGGPPGETLGERLVRMLDEGLSQKRDVEDLFAQLEQEAGIEPEEDEDDGLDDEAMRAVLASSFKELGDLEPLILEFLWEEGGAAAPFAATLQLWVELQKNAPLSHVDLDDVSGRDLMRLLLHVYLQAPAAARAAAVHEAVAAVSAFSRWAEATQEMSLQSALDGCKGALLEHLERLESAGLRLSSPPSEQALAPAMMRVEDCAAHGFGVRLEDAHYWIEAAAECAALLREGDLVLGALAKGSRGHRLCGPVVVLPQDAEELIG